MASLRRLASTASSTLPIANSFARPSWQLRSFSSSPFTTAVLPPLPYAYNALEPAISGQIMETHHTKHHQTYVTNLNNALTQLSDPKVSSDVSKQIALQGAIRFNGGGHINHSIFWTNLAPKRDGGGEVPDEKAAIYGLIQKEFQSFDKLKAAMSTACVGIQGSGWGWLVYNSAKDRVEIVTRANQDPVVEAGFTPLLGIDVWEHAYYYLYGPQRAKYLEAIWGIVNWRNVEERLQKALKK